MNFNPSPSIYLQAANRQTRTLPTEKGPYLLSEDDLQILYQKTQKIPTPHQGMKLVQQIEENLDQSQLEIFKAVAQAWHGHTNKSSSNTREADPCRHKFNARPSRFKMERLKYLIKNGNGGDGAANWDFGQSLWDSYEVVTVSKRLEDGMVLEQAFAKPYSRKHSVDKSKEAANSLRFLFNQMSSRRFSEP